MQLRNSLALSLLAGSALAQPVQHHAHRREADAEAAVDYVTLWQTYYVTAGDDGVPTTTSAEVPKPTSVVPTTSASPVAESSSSASPVAPSTSESSSTPESSSSEPTTSSTSQSSTSETHAATTSSSSSAASTTSESSSSAPASSSASSSAPAASAGSAGALGITYSPYSNSGGCKSSSEVASELSKLTGYSVIRLYGVDCNQVSNVYNAKADHQKLFLGVYDVGNIDADIQTIHDGINGDWSVVETVSIGNELVNGGQATVSQVSGYVQQGRSKLSSLGYNGPVVAVDTFIATINNPGLCDISDYMAVNAHAYFDGGVTSSEAGSWANEQIQRVWSACGGKKKVTIVESGWPSKGDSNGKAVASTSDQSAAIDSLKETIGNDCYLFTAFNDLWKSPGYLNVEQWWGLYGSSSE